MSAWQRVAREVVRGALDIARRRVRAKRDRSRPATARSGQSARSAGSPPGKRSAYAGDFNGTPDLSYAPNDDGDADPGEVVWAWVPYEEDHNRGKDRPVLVIGRQDGLLLALPLTSKDHDRDAAQEASVGRRWIDIGTGGWDRQGRPSEVRVDRILQLDPDGVRREGGKLDRQRFDAVSAEVRRFR
ncbi:MAG: type II toxin-antitoxin system PemK/MazF family toxin [Propionibacteriales bacterium]|nr:type II toxin-antitoxin system PemK/MazF family toxin [Propionibacteriales bacterium]